MKSTARKFDESRKVPAYRRSTESVFNLIGTTLHDGGPGGDGEKEWTTEGFLVSRKTVWKSSPRW